MPPTMRLGNARAGMGVDAADINGDGRPDLYVGTFRNEHNMLYENLGDGLFQDSSSRYGVVADSLPNVKWGTQFADFDLDGWLDLIVTNGHVDDNLHLLGQDASYAELPLCYRNLAGKRFQFLGTSAGAYFAQPHVGRGLVTADLDNDGDLDVAISHQDDLPAVLRNTALERQPEAATLSLRLVGTVSNRDAIGAAVRCRSQRGTLTQQVKGGSSYNSAPDLRQVFAVQRGESGSDDSSPLAARDGFGHRRSRGGPNVCGDRAEHTARNRPPSLSRECFHDRVASARGASCPSSASAA